MMQLEEELGTKLFTRGKHNIYLTEDGMLLKKRAQDIVALADRTEKEFTDRQEELSGEIVFGCGESSGVSDLVEIIASFQKKNIQWFRLKCTQQLQMILKSAWTRGIIDIGLLAEPVDISKYSFLRLKKKGTVGRSCAIGFELAKKSAVTPENLVGVPLLMAKRPLVKSELENWFGEYYDRLQIAGTYNLLNNAATMVEHGIGAALCFQIGNYYKKSVVCSIFAGTGNRQRTGMAEEPVSFQSGISFFLTDARNALQA